MARAPPDEQLLDSVEAESATVLSLLDHAAIVYFRFVLAPIVYRKLPEHSGPAIVWMLAQKDPMVMHSICAFAGRSVCDKVTLLPGDAQARRSLAMEHYSASLRLLHVVLHDYDRGHGLNCILATLWLMIAYEQKFGDGSGKGLNTHLQGAATLFQERLRDMRGVLSQDFSSNSSAEALTAVMKAGSLEHSISPVTCQLIVWIALLDSGAALNGIGGAFNRVVGECLIGPDADNIALRLSSFQALQARSDMARFAIWTSSYARDQLAEDVQNSQIFTLEAEAGQLRFMLSLLDDPEQATVSDMDSLSSAYRRNHDDTRNTASHQHGCLAIARAIHDINNRYHSLLETANLFQISDMESPSQKRFVINVRYIVSFYHAVVLCFLRIIHGQRPLVREQQVALREIMMLASKAYGDYGDQSLAVFAWPLFVVALESDDMIHKNWIVERYESLARGGENLLRARDALRIVIREQQEFGDRYIGYAELVRREGIGRFVLL
ncbi:unnamed protein product [Clonostachys rosea]|uniref:Transcription factor domain-containing protein n=1 Tax=Bionectria ochroleuca TaxID=29856 RepID=A0ABY6U8Q0_BIOOC|nr:unnamed protein product [Clonostachys rosea]